MTSDVHSRRSTEGTAWHHAAFRRLFAAAAVSQLGTQVGYVALPLLAVVALRATPAEVGALAALGTAAFLLIGLPAGPWVDRLRRRPLMIGADVARSVLLASLPVSWSLGVLTMHQLYAVVFLCGCATVFFDVSVQSHLPDVVGREALISANSALVGLQAGANVAGRGLGGFLVQLVSAPAAVVMNAAGYLGSAILLAGPRGARTLPSPGPGHERGRPRIREGLHHVLRGPHLRALALSGAVTNLGTQIVVTMLPVLFVRELGLSASTLGAFLAAGGLGVVLGSRLARPLAQRLGLGRTLWATGIVTAPAALAMPLVDGGVWLWAAAAGWLVTTAKSGVSNVLAVSLRQSLTPTALLGRMNATFRFLLTGALTLGSVAAGLLGHYASLRTALWVGAGCLALSWLPLALSPVRHLHSLPAGDDAG